MAPNQQPPLEKVENVNKHYIDKAAAKRARKKKRGPGFSQTK